MKKIYDANLFADEVGKMSFNCFSISQDEVKLKSFNLILSSFLYKSEVEMIKKTKLPITSSREFYAVEMPLYIRIIDKFLHFLPTTWKEMSNYDNLPTVIEGARTFAKGLYTNAEFVDQARACSAIIARIERNQELFALYLSGIRAILVDVLEKVGRKIAADPRSALIVAHTLQSPKKILEQIKNHRVLVEPNGEIYDLENYDKELEEEMNKRRGRFNLGNVAKTAVTASTLTAMLVGAILGFQSNPQ